MAGFNLNTVTLSGGLTFDPDLRATPSGISVCTLRMAFTERVKNNATDQWEDKSGYVDVTVWGGVGEWCSRDLHKGSQVVVTGRLQYQAWNDKETGKPRSKLQIVADSIFRDRGAGGGGAHEDATGAGFAARDTGGFGDPPGGGFQAREEPQSTHATATTPADDDIPF